MKKDIVQYVVPGVLAIILAVLSFFLSNIEKQQESAKNGQKEPNIMVVHAQLAKSVISPHHCLKNNPCSGLRRGNVLHVVLNQPGYASAYLQDGYGNYFNQNGNLIVENGKVGDSKIWPGTKSRPAGEVMKLWVLTSKVDIPTFPGTKKLRRLPGSANGVLWGPIYLKPSEAAAPPANVVPTATPPPNRVSDQRPNIIAEIVSPENGATVSSTILVDVHINKPNSGRHIWIMIKRGKLFWPKEPEVSANRSKYQISEEGSGLSDFTLGIYSISSHGQAQIKRWLKNGYDTGKWPGLGYIHGMQLLDSVELKYAAPYSENRIR